MTTAADLVARRSGPGLALAESADAVAAAALDMAGRFEAGGTLFAFGAGPTAADARHVAVEFVHPVIVGKPALPAIAVPPDGVAALAHAGDLALGLGDDPAVLDALALARAAGLLTVALTGVVDGVDADHHLAVDADDPLVVREVQVTTYHLLWELVHLYLEQGA